MGAPQTIIEYKGRMHIFERPLHMTDKMFQDRCWYIVKNKGDPDIEARADLWIAETYYGCGYKASASAHAL